QPVSAVAGTIFPAADYINHGVRGVYEVYPEETYPNILSPGEWGRYAHRFVRSPSDSCINPLKRLVERLKSQLANGKRMRACYELGLGEVNLDIPLYNPEKDSKRVRNGPCLSHVSFTLGKDNILHLSALYRSHSYVEKALGNFLGLAALQAFVCAEAALSPGPMVCLSTSARLGTDGSWSTRDAMA